MTVDWDGKIRMDCSSPYAMARLIGLRDRFDVAFANDTDADRHGIVTRSNGLMNPNHYLAARSPICSNTGRQWRKDSAVGKTIVSSAIIDPRREKARAKTGAKPRSVQWFVDGLIGGAFGFAGEESAGRLVPQARRHGVDHRQGRRHPGPAGRRDDRGDQKRSEPVVRPADRRARRALLLSGSTRRHARQKSL